MSVYFFHRDSDGLVKIGTTRDVMSRVRQFGLGEIVAAIPGGRVREYLLHRRFQNDRVTGEWFRTSAALIADMTEAAATGDIAGLPAEPSPVTGREWHALRISLGLTTAAVARRIGRHPAILARRTPNDAGPADSVAEQVAYLEMLRMREASHVS